MTEQEILRLIETSRDAKKVFFAMEVDAQIEALYTMILFLRSQQATGQKEHVEMQRDIRSILRELGGIGRRNQDRTLTTSQKINLALEKRGMAWVWFRDKVLPNLVTWFLIIVLTGILYTSFGGKLP